MPICYFFICAKNKRESVIFKLDILFIIKAIIIAIVEGLTEFIPVSSTGHMILVGNIINFTRDFRKYV